MNNSTTTNTITIGGLLHGTGQGQVQSAGNMQVIPLVSDIEYKNYVSPLKDNVIISTDDYGVMRFNNSSEELLIIPSHAGWIVEQSVQNHAMTHAGLVSDGQCRTFDTAACIQASQSGLIQSGNYNMMILPFSLREKALEVRKEKSYSKLWNSITAFNNSLGIESIEGHLEEFLKQFKKQLEQFTAEFENIPNQVGAVILINNEVMGIERAPSYNYWRSVWPCLIRECYGSLAIQMASVGKDKLQLPKTRVPLRQNITSIDDLQEALFESEKKESEIVDEIINKYSRISLITENDDNQRDDDLDRHKIETFFNDRFTGQLIREESEVVYTSAIASKKMILQKAGG